MVHTILVVVVVIGLAVSFSDLPIRCPLGCCGIDFCFDFCFGFGMRIGFGIELTLSKQARTFTHSHPKNQAEAEKKKKKNAIQHQYTEPHGAFVASQTQI